MPHARVLGFIAGVPAGVVYFFLFGSQVWQSLAVGLFVSSLFSVLAGIFLAVVKVAQKLNVNLDEN